jgi:hypothetical protein
VSINADLNAVPLKNASCTGAAQKGAFAIKAMLNGAGSFTTWANFVAWHHWLAISATTSDGYRKSAESLRQRQEREQPSDRIPPFLPGNVPDSLKGCATSWLLPTVFGAFVRPHCELWCKLGKLH